MNEVGYTQPNYPINYSKLECTKTGMNFVVSLFGFFNLKFHLASSFYTLTGHCLVEGSCSKIVFWHQFWAKSFKPTKEWAWQWLWSHQQYMEILKAYLKPNSLMAKANQLKVSDWFLGFFCSNAKPIAWKKQSLNIDNSGWKQQKPNQVNGAMTGDMMLRYVLGTNNKQAMLAVCQTVSLFALSPSSKSGCHNTFSVFSSKAKTASRTPLGWYSTSHSD